MTAHRLILTICAAMTFAAPATAKQQAQADPAHPLVISDPDWVRVPNGAELARLYPQAAAAEHVAGRTKAMCHVLADGALDACVVLEECPRGYGFGRATLMAAQDFQMRPKTVDGVAVEGGAVVVPMVWTLDASAPVAACAPEAADPTVASVAEPSLIAFTQAEPAYSGPVQPAPVPGPPPLPAPFIIANPDWEQTPSADTLAALFPDSARARHLSGEAAMRCLANLDGRLMDCAIVSESPRNSGFGRATIQSARYFKLRPTTRDGAPVYGGSVTIPIEWRLP